MTERRFRGILRYRRKAQYRDGRVILLSHPVYMALPYTGPQRKPTGAPNEFYSNFTTWVVSDQGDDTLARSQLHKMLDAINTDRMPGFECYATVAV